MSDDLVEKLQEMLEGGKTIPPALRDQMMLALLVSLNRKTGDLQSAIQGIDAANNAKISALRNEMRSEFAFLRSRCIMCWIEKHPKLAAFLAVVLLSAVNMWFVSGFRKPVLAWLLGVPPDLIP